MFGTSLPSGFGPPTAYILGPAGDVCQADIGGDGSFYISLSAPGTPKPSLHFTFSPGGAGLNVDLPCPYIPAVHAADILFRHGDTAGCPAAPAGDVVTQVATGSSSVVAAVVVAPAGTIDPRLETSGAPGEATLAIFGAELYGADGTGRPPFDGANAQEADCSLPGVQRAVCLAALDLFVTESFTSNAVRGDEVTPALIAAVTAAIDNTGRPAGVAQPAECRGSGAADLEREINMAANSRIPIPANGIALPAGLPGTVTVAFVPGEVQICKNDLSPILNTPGGFVSGELSIGAADSAGGRADHGPFVYSASATAWTQVPGAPPGQVLTSKFSPAGFEAAVNPQLAVAFTKAGPTVGFQVASATLSAANLTVTLVSGAGPLLQVSLGPTLQLAVQVSKGAIEKAVEDEEAQGVDEATAVEDVSDELAADTTVGIDLEVSEYYDVIVTTAQKQAAFVGIRDAVAVALDGDAAIADFAASAADAVATGDSVAAESAAIDAELGAGEVIEVGGIDEFLLFLLL